MIHREALKLQKPGTLIAGLWVTATSNDDAEDQQNEIKNKMYGTHFELMLRLLLLDNTTSTIIIGVSSPYIFTALKYQIYSFTGVFRVLLT